MDVHSAFETGVGPGGLAWVKIKHPSGSTCTVHLFGATVTSVTSAAGRELLFTSKASAWDGSGPIRGGIPVVFPYCDFDFSFNSLLGPQAFYHPLFNVTTPQEHRLGGKATPTP